ncbi:MAG: exodeoxyribonuclease VII small subunit [Gemmatimonadota bacterium]|nr:MAG: exodeoxyribonuclease VII small subunit [Gemmatimonadota bacterium]
MATSEFEMALKRLEEIVRELEKGDLSLEDSLKLFEEGMEMSRTCAQKLTAAKEKLQLFHRGKDGTFQTEPLDKT